MTRTYKTEFPDFTLPSIAIPEGFVDCSWHNDLCPSWSNEKLELILYIDRENPDEREFPDFKRYTLAGADNDVKGWAGETLCESEDFADIEAYLQKLPAKA